jgi:Protein of unknown function (DUF642)
MAFPRFQRRKASNRTALHLNLLALEDRTVPSAATIAPAVTGIQDFGFESVNLAAGTFKYGAAGSAWSFAGTAGVSANNSAFTSGNPSAPQGGQVALLQNRGTITETVTLAAGTYTLGFSAAQRGNKASAQTFEVLVDGQVVGNFNSLTGATYSNLSTSSFTVTAGPHTISFQGTNASGGDNTVFIDNVSLTQQAAGLNDSGFELPAVAVGAYKYDPTGSPWTFVGNAGVAGNASLFTAGNPIAPQGSQVVFVQNVGSLHQAVTFTAGTYTISFSAAQRGNKASSQTFQVLVDGKVVGSFNSLTGTTYTTLTTSSFTVTAGTHVVTIQGTNLNGGDNTAFIDQVTVNQQTTSLADSGFEGFTMPNGGFEYDPTGSPWAFSGGAGVSGNGTAFTGGNQPAPQGSQVTFLQGISGISQAVTFTAGTYTIGFSAAQRGNGGGAQTIQVLVDGNVVGTFNNLTGTGYSTLTTSSFLVTAGSHVITIEGTDNNGGDNTAFVDQVAINQVTTGVTDPGFELEALGPGGYTYRPTGSAWNFAGSAGVAGNGSAFTSGNPAAPQGTQVMFLQGNGNVSQSMTFSAGTYTLTFNAAQRGNVASAQTFQVLVDGNVVGTFNNLTGTGYGTQTTGSFTVTAGSHTVTFQGTNLKGGDNTALIDNVAINPQATTLGDTGFENAIVAPGGFVYAPKGTPWTFTGGAGVASNGSAFTAGNPAAPQGSQVLFLQGVSGITQVATFPAGTYTLSLSAAARANAGGNQTVQVLVDGSVVGTFAITGKAYSTLTTSSFSLSAGNHIIAIQGTNKVGDNTALIDQVSVNPQ